MIALLNNSLSRRALYAAALASAALRYYSPRRRKIWRHRVAFYEQAWRDAAEQLGATFTTLHGDIAEIKLGEFVTRVQDNYSQIDDPVTMNVLSNKLATYKILKREGLPIPDYTAFTYSDPSPTTRFLAEHTRGCVIKPAAGTGGGRGITAGIRTHAQLLRAAAAAAVYCKELLIEEQLRGDNYRLLYLDGKLIDAFIRNPPAVTGDGRSTVRALVHRANEERLELGSKRSQVLLTIDLDMKRTLARQNLSLHSIPSPGQVIVLKTVINENAGDDNINVTHVLHPAIIEEGERAVSALGIRLGGVDIVTPDHTASLRATGGAIIEVNAPPNFYYHYHQQEGPFRVAFHVLKSLLNDPPSIKHSPAVSSM